MKSSMSDAELARRADETGMRFGKKRFAGSVSQWCAESIKFNEPKRVGEFSFYGREYLRKPLDCYGIDSIHDEVLCFGTRTGKTTIMFGGAAFRAHERARRSLFVLPGSKGTAGAESIARTRFIPMLRASECMAELIPAGSRRHDFKTAQQMLRNGSIIDWTGSNSVAQLASNSMEDVYQDEIDKFNTTRRRDSSGNEVEADAVDLADERTGEYSHPKRVKSSTPTLVSGRIWVELMKTDLQRRFIPCPLCGRHHPSSRGVVLAWSKTYTILPHKFSDGQDIPIAFVQWDDEAKRQDGTWDYERVEKSAGYVCPHCNGRFLTKEKAGDLIWMDRNGWWQPTQTGAPRAAGFHLPSMYANHESAQAGVLAVSFLKTLKSLGTARNVINSKFAEPYLSQDQARERVEIIRSPETKIEITAEWRILLTADAQQKWPYLWYVKRAWNGGDSEGLTAGHCDTFDDLRAIQLEPGAVVIDSDVLIDSGFGARREADVYRNCARFGLAVPRPQGLPPLFVGWMPAKGMPYEKRWKHPKTKTPVPYCFRYIDPFLGTTEAQKIETNLFEFSGMYYEDILNYLRDPKAKHGYKWAVSQQMDKATFEDGSSYWRHMDGHIKKTITNKLSQRTREEYVKRHRDWPDHLLDCEIEQVALANAYDFFRLEIPKGEK